MKIFLGSSRECLDELREVSSWLEDEDVAIIPWNRPELFLPGQNTYARLIKIAEEVDAAIFIFGEDDALWYRSDGLKQPRDNVLLEYGLFSGILGTQRTVVCRQDSAKTPSDLAGIVVVDISERHRNAAQKKMVAWVKEQLSQIAASHPFEVERGRVVLLTKATTGFTKELTDTIKQQVDDELPKVELITLHSAVPEFIRRGDFIGAMSKHPEVIMITPPPNSGELVGPIIDALKQGIPVITVDDQLDPKPFIDEGLLPPINIACDYADGGKKAAKEILNKLGYRGNIAIISGPKNSYSSQIRKMAFIDTILCASPNTSIVSVKETNWNPLVGEEKMREILAEVDDLDALFCCNDRLALRAVQAIKDSGRFDAQLPVVVGHDGIKEVFEAIRRREVYVTINQHMDQLARLAVDELRKVFEDKSEYIRQHNFLIQLETSVIRYEDVISRLL